MMRSNARRLLALLRLIKGRWAAIIVPLIAVAVFAYKGTMGATVWAMIVFVIVPFLLLRSFLQQLAGDSEDTRDAGQPLSRGVRILLVVFGGLGFASLISLIREGAAFGFAGMSVVFMSPIMITVGLRGRAFGELGRNAGGRRVPRAASSAESSG